MRAGARPRQLVQAKLRYPSSPMNELTLAEKCQLLSGADFWRTKAITRGNDTLVPALLVTDGPHGVRKKATATDDVGIEGQSLQLAFQRRPRSPRRGIPKLLHRVGQALGQEARANGVSVLLGPGMNIKRSPLCGRKYTFSHWRNRRIRGALGPEC